jgi:hypothetical protein
MQTKLRLGKRAEKLVVLLQRGYGGGCARVLREVLLAKTNPQKAKGVLLED